MSIVCERFTTSKLTTFQDLETISTFGFRGEALASISHVAQLTITTKTAQEKVAYKASYIDSKLKSPPRPIAGNQGTTILIENLFYNVATRRKALSNTSEEFSKISEVITRYAIHNPTVGFTLKKQGNVIPQIRTPHDSTKINNIKSLYGNPVARELIEINLNDTTYKFSLQALITNPNYSCKRMTFLLFINHRLVDSILIKKMLEDLYSIYLPKKTYPWCYISLEINPNNVDVNVHPTKCEVRFLHEEAIIDRVKAALDEKLSSNNAARTFYLQARLPEVAVSKEALAEVMPEFTGEKDKDKTIKKIYAKEMIRTDARDQKLDQFNFTVHNISKSADNNADNVSETAIKCNNQSNPRESIMIIDNVDEVDDAGIIKTPENNEALTVNKDCAGLWSSLVDDISTQASSNLQLNPEDIITSTQIERNSVQNNILPACVVELMSSDSENSTLLPEIADEGSVVADRAIRTVFQRFGSQIDPESSKIAEETVEKTSTITNVSHNNKEKINTIDKNDCDKSTQMSHEFKSYSINNFRRDVKLTSVLKLRKTVEDNYHEGLRKIISEMTFVGCVDEKYVLIQSDVNLYICNTTKLAEELFYEIALYDFANYGVLKFTEKLPLIKLALIGLELDEAGWTEEDGPKQTLAEGIQDLLMEKAEILKEYFSIVIDKHGNLKTLPVLLEKYFPSEVELPMFILRLATEIDWSNEQECFDGICREIGKFYSHINPNHKSYDWRHLTELILYPAIKESLLPPNHFAHDSTILQIASLPNLYKVFERC